MLQLDHALVGDQDHIIPEMLWLLYATSRVVPVANHALFVTPSHVPSVLGPAADIAGCYVTSATREGLGRPLKSQHI